MDKRLFKPVPDEDVEARPPELGQKTNYSVREVLKALKKNGVNLGYTGLMYYRDLGLIPPPVKEKGTKERFYDVLELQERIMAIKLISSIFDLNYQETASYAKRLPLDTFNKLPIGFMRVYVDVQAKFDKMTREKKIVNPTGPFDMWIFEGIKIAFLRAVDDTIKMAETMNAEAYYMEVVKDLILAQGVKEIRTERKAFLKS